MKRFLLILLVLCPVAARATVGVVQCQSAWMNNVASVTISISPTPGNALVTFLHRYNNNGSTLTVTASNSVQFAQDDAVVITPGTAGDRAYIHRYSNLPAGITSLTFTLSANDYAVAFACEVSGLDAAPLDVADSVGATAHASWTTGPIATTNGHDIVFGTAWNYFNAWALTASAPWTVAAHTESSAVGAAGIVAYQIVSSTGTYQPSGSGGYSNGGLAIAYKYVGPPPGGSTIRHRVTSN